ncbi:DGAT1/2-independent enzyme synthesizing storage lipids-like [Tiliqua scincoides]|uniref:DGAT1/2-independent enzyme synthesizing storage lipids-like n=1 Tax=Tiliqua scincoides TaxID=71010 RepID=UPI0034622564
MIASTALEASGEEDAVTWFTPILRNWIGFAYLGDYLSYALWLIVPVLLVYSLPLAIYCFVCVVNFALYIYQKKNNMQEHPSSKSWDKARKVVSYLVRSFGKIWHGFEIIGLEHLPEGSGLIIYYHGALGIDYACFVSTLYILTGRCCYSVSDHFLFGIPGIQLVLGLTGCGDRNKADCVAFLKKGELLGIAPGGLREQNFSDGNYNLIWGNRTGFAQVATEAKVPIIPIFTQNTREAYWTFGNTWLTRWLYESIRWVILPVYGGFPVKLRTYIGEPIPYDPNITAKELAEKTKTAIENLRDRYQKRPGNIMKAFLERFDKHHKEN